MARSFYKAHNRFVLNSKMNEQTFKVWLTLYLQGISVSEAMAKFPALAGADAPMPSAKTVTNLFRRMGRYIFHKGFEPYLWSINRGIPAKHLAKGPGAYQDHLDSVARNIIDHAKDAITLEQFHAMTGSRHVGHLGDRIAMEIRALLVARKGVSDPRADVGLAFLRALTPGSLPRNKMHADHVLEMAENALQYMLNDPMDEEGNTHSYLRRDPSKIHYNNNGIFEKKYWATHGQWIWVWQQRQKYKKEKRRLGYIRTVAGEQNLKEQRDALATVGCELVFEDIDVSPETTCWPGLDALLNQTFDFDVVVVLSLDRFGPYDKQWTKVMKAIWKGGAELCAIEEEFDTSRQILKERTSILRKP
ncbi:MAG: recombinase family protein [Pseudomonadota bacterium]